MLAGQPAAYLAQEMKNYAEGIRADTSRKGVMAKELRLLSERDYEDLAAYYEAQKRY
jgi:cytochrome c553